METIVYCIAGQGINCAPFDASGHFKCGAGDNGAPRKAVHEWTNTASGEHGYFCGYHSPFDLDSISVTHREETADEVRDRARQVLYTAMDDALKAVQGVERRQGAPVKDSTAIRAELDKVAKLWGWL